MVLSRMAIPNCRHRMTLRKHLFSEQQPTTAMWNVNKMGMNGKRTELLRERPHTH